MSLFFRRGILSAAIAVACAGATAAPASTFAGSSAIAIPDIPYTKFVLKNGLTVLVHEDHKAPIVAVNTWYHVGSKMKSWARPASPTCSNT